MLSACADGSDPAFRDGADPFDEVGSVTQPLSGTLGGETYTAAAGLAPLETNVIGLYQEPLRADFTPSRSYLDITVPGPGRFRIGEEASLEFIICPAGSTRCTRTTPLGSRPPATFGAVDVVEDLTTGTLRVSAIASDELGDSVEGTFSGVLVFSRACERNTFACQNGQVLRCAWDQRSQQPVSVDECASPECASVLATCAPSAAGGD